MEYTQSRQNGVTNPLDNISAENVAYVCVCAPLMRFMYKSIWFTVTHSRAIAHTRTRKYPNIYKLPLWNFQIKVLLHFEKMRALWAHAFQHPSFVHQHFIRCATGFTCYQKCVRVCVWVCFVSCRLAKHKNSPLKVFHLTDWKIALGGNRKKK